MPTPMRRSGGLRREAANGFIRRSLEAMRPLTAAAESQVSSTGSPVPVLRPCLLSSGMAGLLTHVIFPTYVVGGRPCRWWSILGGKPSHGYIDFFQIESLGGGKADVSNAPTATPQTAGLRSPSQ
jgi:hypothetical protein